MIRFLCALLGHPAWRANPGPINRRAGLWQYRCVRCGQVKLGTSRGDPWTRPQ